MGSLYGELGVIGMRGCEDFANQVDSYLREWRRHGDEETYLMTADCPRFGSGEAKAIVHESMRGHDLYIITDMFNHSVKFKMYGQDVPMSPDDHYADLKRIIAAAGGKARRISVIMPMLYEGRQHKRTTRESLDCALALQELVNMGVTNIITFDAHDPRVSNAIPLSGFDNVRPTYQMLKALTKKYPDISLSKDDIMVVAPDEGAMSRSMYYASVMGIELGMFYKRRNYSIIVNGKNPIEAHEYLGRDIKGKDVIVVDDMLASGESILDVSLQLKEKGAKRVFLFLTFADLKRIIAAAGGKARRISVIMPMLYEGRQHKRTTRESLDCALALQELVNMGVTNIITFDAHDPRVSNAIPLSGFDNVRPTYQMLKALTKKYPDISLSKDDIMVVAPDEGAMSRSMYYASVMGIELGMFYKRRNYSIIVNGKNPIEAHEYLGRDIKGKDVIVVDDMLASGESILDVSLQLKEKGAKRVFLFLTFAIFTSGYEVIEKAYNEGIFTQIFATNLVYAPDELLQKPWFTQVNMCKYVAYIIDTLNHDESISTLLNPVKRIHALLEKQQAKLAGLKEEQLPLIDENDHK